MDEGNTPHLDKKNGNEKNTEMVYKSLLYESGKEERLIADDTNEARGNIFLCYSALTADLVMFFNGCSLVWSSPAIQKLRSTDLEINPLGIPVTPFQESCIAALLFLGSIVCPMLFGRLADRYGRRKIIISLSALNILIYITLSFATNIYFYYIARFLVGIDVGMGFVIILLYNGEICENRNRGKFVCTMYVFLALGSLYTLSIAPLLSLKMFTLSCTIPLMFVFISFIFVIPETPVYLASINDTENAIKAIMKLRTKTKRAAEKDLINLMQIKDISSSSITKGNVEILKSPALRKALIICLGLLFFQEFSGYTTVMAFIGPIFDLSGSDISANFSSILVAAVQTVTILATSVLVDKLGRKFLLLISIICSLICLSILGVYFHLKDNEFYYIQSINWVPVATLIAYVIFYNLGLGPIPWTVVSEVFPPNVSSTASSIATSFVAFSSFCVTFMLPLIIEYLSMAVFCWLLGGICALGTIFIYFIVPETKGKTIIDIQNILSK